MPYVKIGDRIVSAQVIALAEAIVANSPGFDSDKGMLNYAFTRLIAEVLRKRGIKVGYAQINDLVGVLECCKLELYRAVAAPYEDVKRRQNGDVYGDVKFKEG